MNKHSLIISASEKNLDLYPMKFSKMFKNEFEEFPQHTEQIIKS